MKRVASAVVKGFPALKAFYYENYDFSDDDDRYITEPPAALSKVEVMRKIILDAFTEANVSLKRCRLCKLAIKFVALLWKFIRPDIF